MFGSCVLLMQWTWAFTRWGGNC